MYKLLLCMRYLRTRYIALASIVSVMLGVATMIVVNSVMAGFSTEMRERIHGLLADVVIVGRSFGRLHGSDMMEPIALGKPTLVGPAVDDFQDTVDALREGDGIVQTSRTDLARDLARLLEDTARCRTLAENGRAVIRAHQGATARHARMLADLLEQQASQSG